MGCFQYERQAMPLLIEEEKNKGPIGPLFFIGLF